MSRLAAGAATCARDKGARVRTGDYGVSTETHCFGPLEMVDLSDSRDFNDRRLNLESASAPSGQMGSYGERASATTRADMVYATLRRAIIEGELLPGDPVGESELGKRFGVSRTPVREALRRLQADGLVKATPYRGTFITYVSRRDVLDAFDFRVWVEPPLFLHATQRMTEESLGFLEERIRAMPVHPTTRSDALVAVAEDLAFHAGVLGISGNRFAVGSLNEAFDVTRRAVNISPPARFEQARNEHLQILRALTKRDGAGAAEAVRAHIANARRRFSGGYDE